MPHDAPVASVRPYTCILFLYPSASNDMDCLPGPSTETWTWPSTSMFIRYDARLSVITLQYLMVLLSMVQRKVKRQGKNESGEPDVLNFCRGCHETVLVIASTSPKESVGLWYQKSSDRGRARTEGLSTGRDSFRFPLIPGDVGSRAEPINGIDNRKAIRASEVFFIQDILVRLALAFNKNGDQADKNRGRIATPASLFLPL